jgi:DNA-directed RNA polymerase subunit RPC12/RpoP
MQPRIFHGDVTPNDFASAMLAQFNQGPWRAQQFGSGQKIVVQIATREYPASGGKTAMSVTLEQVEDGVLVQFGQQSWLNVAASLGISALSAWRNPWSLLGRLDDIAQDIENLNLTDTVWEVVEGTARSAGATFELSERLRRVVCEYCRTANPVGEPNCLACGAPLGDQQPLTCPNCGFVVSTGELSCPNCGQALAA